MEFLDPEFLGAIVRLVKVLRHPFEAGTVAQSLPATGFVSRRLEELPIDKTLDQENRMLVLRLPIRREAFQAQAHGSGSQIGKLLPLDQDDEPAVLGQKV